MVFRYLFSFPHLLNRRSEEQSTKIAACQHAQLFAFVRVLARQYPKCHSNHIARIGKNHAKSHPSICAAIIPDRIPHPLHTRGVLDFIELKCCLILFHLVHNGAVGIQVAREML